MGPPSSRVTACLWPSVFLVGGLAWNDGSEGWGPQPRNWGGESEDPQSCRAHWLSCSCGAHPPERSRWARSPLLPCPRLPSPAGSHLPSHSPGGGNPPPTVWKGLSSLLQFSLRWFNLKDLLPLSQNIKIPLDAPWCSLPWELLAPSLGGP